MVFNSKSKLVPKICVAVSWGTMVFTGTTQNIIYQINLIFEFEF